MHFQFTSMTGNNAQVAIPVSANPNVGGTPLEPGDEIGAFSPTGLCCGAVAWIGGTQNVALCVWGAEPIGNMPGMADGDKIAYKIWRQSDNKEYPVDVVIYSDHDPVNPSVRFPTDGTYHANAFMAVDSFSGPLPVQLSQLEFSVIGGRTVEVAWRTESETNCYAFRIERRLTDASEWSPVAMIPGQGTKVGVTDYSYVDTAPSDGIFEYRLIQVDLSGKETVYSAPAVTIAAVPTPATEEEGGIPYWVIALAVFVIGALAYIIFH
jgi:hypothetical protein